MTDEWVLSSTEVGVIVLALEHALMDCYLDEGDSVIASNLLREMR